MRIAYIMATDIIWNYDCNLTYGCYEYNTIMSYLLPYKGYIQSLSSCIIEAINLLLQESDVDILRREIQELRTELQQGQTELQQGHISHSLRLQYLESPHICLTVDDDLIPEDHNHRALYNRRRNTQRA